MQVAATHAALLLAQGAGRLIRTTTDRGVVAVLDPRLVTARYGGFLKASLPPMWATTDPDVVRKALKRLADAPDGAEVSLKPSQITSQPTSTSATQWLPVPMTTRPVMIACTQPRRSAPSARGGVLLHAPAPPTAPSRRAATGRPRAGWSGRRGPWGPRRRRPTSRRRTSAPARRRSRRTAAAGRSAAAGRRPAR